MRENISHMIDIKHNIESNRVSCAEVLLVTDENSAMFTSQNEMFQIKTMQETQAQVALSGMPYDMYRLCDLSDIPIDKYKVIFFINCFKISEQENIVEFRIIQRLYLTIRLELCLIMCCH